MRRTYSKRTPFLPIHPTPSSSEPSSCTTPAPENVKTTHLNLGNLGRDGENDVSCHGDPTGTPNTLFSSTTQLIRETQTNKKKFKITHFFQPSVSRNVMKDRKCKSVLTRSGGFITTTHLVTNVANPVQGLVPDKDDRKSQVIQLKLNLPSSNPAGASSLFITCPECGMEYARKSSAITTHSLSLLVKPSCAMDADEQEGEKIHKKYHDSVMKRDFLIWPDVNEASLKPRILAYHLGGKERILLVTTDTTSGTTKSELSKVLQLFNVINVELGSFAFGLDDIGKTFVYLGGDSGRRIMGAVSTVTLTCAYRMESETDIQGSFQIDLSKPVPASCGVNRIWVHSKYRRRGIAHKLLECVCESLTVTEAQSQKSESTPLPKHLLAFSQPTRLGLALARSFTGRTFPLVFP